LVCKNDGVSQNCCGEGVVTCADDQCCSSNKVRFFVRVVDHIFILALCRFVEALAVPIRPTNAWVPPVAAIQTSCAVRAAVPLETSVRGISAARLHNKYAESAASSVAALATATMEDAARAATSCAVQTETHCLISAAARRKFV
jgi:hypothetical protein